MLRRLTTWSAIAGCAMLTMVTAANAYSDEAVQDAQRLVDWMSKRYAGGTASLDDLARARYELLDMQRKAGKMTHAAFCQAAHTELDLVAKLGKGDQPADKKKWQRQIAVMAKSSSDCDHATATADGLIYGLNEPVNSAAGVKAAEERAQKAERSVAAGTMTRREFEQTQYELAAAKYGAKQISLAAYCDEGIRHLNLIVDMTEQELRDGRTDLGDAIGNRLNVERLKATCRGK
jgi:hypothetical protein